MNNYHMVSKISLIKPGWGWLVHQLRVVVYTRVLVPLAEFASGFSLKACCYAVAMQDG